MVNCSGLRVSGSVNGVHAGKGRLLGYVISHDQAQAQGVVFYDSLTCDGTVLHRVYVAPEQCPVYFRFGTGRDEGIVFENGLSVNAGACEAAVWSIGYEG